MPTLGTTTPGGSAYAVGSQRVLSDGFVAAENGVVQSITILTLEDCTQAGNENRLCLYVGAAADSNVVLANSDTGGRLADSSQDIGGRFWCTWNYVAKPVLQAGQTYGLSCVTGATRPWYDTGSGAVRIYNGPNYTDAPADPAGTPSSTAVNLVSIYATYLAQTTGGSSGMMGGVGRVGMIG